MAAIRAHGGILAFTSGNSIAVSDIRSPNAFHIIKLPAGMEGKPAQADEDDGAGSGRTGAGEGAGEGSGLNRALASAFSCRGRYFAVCDDLKKLHIFCTDSPSWTLLSSRTVARRATSLTFTRDDTTVLVADKSGDVYSFPVLTHTNGQEDNEVKDEGKVKDESQVKDEEEEVKDGGEEKTEGQLVLGHLSMVLDVCLAAEDQYVVTCDRDEKIRISHHPNGYNIHAFCLGHTQFVSCLQYIKEFRMLISGSGDGSLAAWNMQGKQLCRARLPEKTKPTPVAPQQPSRLRPEHEEGEDKNDDASGDNDDDEEEKEEERRKEEGEERRAVRQLVYSEGHRLLMVACYSQAEVEVYEVRGEGGLTTTTTTLTHLQTLPVPAAPWSMAWDDSSDTLWVLAPLQGLTLSAFQLRKEAGDEVQQLHRVTEVAEMAEVTEADMDVDMDRSSGVVKTVHTVNKHWPFFADSLNVADELQGLWKTCRQDNVLQYQQRKQKRLQAHHHHQQQQQQQQQQKPQPGKKAKKRQKRGRGEEEAEDLTAGETTAPAAAAAAAVASEERGSEGLPGKKTRHSS